MHTDCLANHEVRAPGAPGGGRPLDGALQLPWRTQHLSIRLLGLCNSTKGVCDSAPRRPRAGPGSATGRRRGAGVCGNRVLLWRGGQPPGRCLLRPGGPQLHPGPG